MFLTAVQKGGAEERADDDDNQIAESGDSKRTLLSLVLDHGPTVNLTSLFFCLFSSMPSPRPSRESGIIIFLLLVIFHDQSTAQP